MSINIYGIKDSANLLVKYKSGTNKGKIFAYADYATVSTNEWTSENVFARSKNVNAIRWDYNRQSTLAVDMEIFDLKWIAMLAGTDIASGAKNVLKREVLTLDSDKKATMTGTATTGSLSVFKLENDGVTNGDEIVVTTGYTISEKAITVTGGAKGDKIVVYYIEAVTGAALISLESATALTSTLSIAV